MTAIRRLHRYREAVVQTRVGLLGCGTVGAALVRLLDERREVIAARTGIDLSIARIAVRSPDRDRGLDIDPTVFTADDIAVAAGEDIDVVVEVMGGIDPARTLVGRALELKKPVVTANKELLAAHGAELFAAADAAGVDLLFEAAVGGAVPLIRPLRESLVGEPVERVVGIVNGTTNYVLTQMAETGASYDEALSEAQSLGYAEADPAADVEGRDAGAKAAIIATVAYGAWVGAADVACEGITGVTAHDMEMAARFGYVVKPVAVVERTGLAGGEPELAVRVHPAMLPDRHPLASVRGSFNAVFVEGAAAGEIMLYGRGAGGRPTASAVLGDLVDAAVNRSTGSAGRIGRLGRARIRPPDELESAFYICLDVADRPGVLAAVADVFGRHRVSIRAMEQHGLGADAQIVFITHEARERDAAATLAELGRLEAVKEIGSVIRVMDADGPGRQAAAGERPSEQATRP